MSHGFDYQYRKEFFMKIIDLIFIIYSIGFSQNYPSIFLL